VKIAPESQAGFPQEQILPCEGFPVRGTAWHPCGMKLTAVLEPAKEGGYTCFVEEVPAAISQGETLAEAKANLLDALKLVLLSQRELAEKDLSPNALREPLEFADA